MAAVIVDPLDRVLAIQRSDNGRWEPPGGVLERGETIEAGLRREVAEETGLAIEPDWLSGVYKHTLRDIVALVFRCRAVGGTPRLSDETRALRWMTPEEVSAAMDPVFAVRVLDALNARPTADAVPSVRDHDGAELVAG